MPRTESARARITPIRPSFRGIDHASSRTFIGFRPRREYRVPNIVIGIPALSKNSQRPILRSPERITRSPRKIISLEKERQKRRSLPEQSRNITPRLKRVPRLDLENPFESKAQEREARGLIDLSGLPVTGVKKIAYLRNGTHNRGLLGTAEIPNERLPRHLRDYYSGRLTFYSDLWENLGKIKSNPKERFRTTVHELLHFHNPLLIDNDPKYGSSENRIQHLQHVIRVANQSARTGEFLNDYHKLLYLRLIHNQISKSVFVHETFAILGDMTAVYPEQLQQVENAQRKKLEMKGKVHTMTEFVSKKRDNGSWSISSTDKTFMAMMPNIKSVEQLHNHWKNALIEAKKVSPNKKRERSKRIEHPYGPSRRQQRIIVFIGYPEKNPIADKIIGVVSRRNRDKSLPWAA